MFRIAVFVTMLAVATNFAPAGRVPTSTTASSFAALCMQCKDTLGAQPQLGFWDPLNPLTDTDEERFDRLRATEIKHGRISMLAILGRRATTAGWQLTGDIAYGIPFTSVKVGMPAFDTMPTAGALQLLLFIGALKLGFGSVQQSVETDCYNYMDAIRWSEKTVQARHRAEQRSRRADGHPCRHGAREARRQPLHHQRPPRCPCVVQPVAQYTN